MFFLAWLRRRSAPAGPAGGSDAFWPRVRRAVTSTTTLLILGVVIIGLADVLSAVGGHGDDGGHDHGGQAKAESAVDEVDGADVSDDHHKVEEEVDEVEVEVEVAQTPEATEEVELEDDEGHHGDEEEEDDDDGHGHSH